MKTCIVLGTRPEIIKFSPIIREFERLGLDYHILHTNQHYSYNMDRIFFEQLGLPEAFDNLDIGSGYHGEQTGKMLMGIEKVLQREAPDVVLVEGDTNTVVAGALAAAKLGIKVGHVEAGEMGGARAVEADPDGWGLRGGRDGVNNIIAPDFGCLSKPGHPLSLFTTPFLF